MKKLRKICIILGMAMALYGCQNSPSVLNVSNSEEGIVTVTAENAKDSSGTGYITVKEGQVIKVTSALSQGSSIRVEIVEEETGDVIAEEVITENDAEIAVPDGGYMLNIIVDNGATGSMTIYAENIR